MTLGIEAAGIAVPYSRVASRDIHAVWGNVDFDVVIRRGVTERAVVDPDADTITLAAEAGIRALEASGRARVDAVILGTQTCPYLTRAGAAVVAEMLGVTPAVFATDVQFAGKSGTAALLLAAAWVAAGFGESALAIGADTLGLHAAPGDPLEYTAGAGAAAFVVSGDARLATIDAHASSTSDMPDAFRADGERYVRSTGAVMTASGIGFADHARAAVHALTRSIEPRDYAHLAVQQPDAATPAAIARALGFQPEQTTPSLLADRIGDAGAASPLLTLARALELSVVGDRTLLVSYGHGAGCDAISLTATADRPDLGVSDAVDRRELVPYATAVRYERRYDGHQRLIGTYE